MQLQIFTITKRKKKRIDFGCKNIRLFRFVSDLFHLDHIYFNNDGDSSGRIRSDLTRVNSNNNKNKPIWWSRWRAKESNNPIWMILRIQNESLINRDVFFSFECDANRKQKTKNIALKMILYNQTSNLKKWCLYYRRWMYSVLDF